MLLFEYNQNFSTIESDNPRLKQLWYGMNTTDNFGCLSYLYFKYNCPSTVDEFITKYVEDADTDKNRKLCGKSAMHLATQALKLREKDNNRCEPKVYNDYLIKKLFYDTMNGLRKEKEMMEIMEDLGFYIQHSNFYEDAKMGVDIWLQNGIGDNVAAIQVKPQSFFIGDSNKSLINDRKEALRKEKYTECLTGCPTFVVIYAPNGEWLKNDNGKYCFTFNQLLNVDGTCKVSRVNQPQLYAN